MNIQKIGDRTAELLNLYYNSKDRKPSDYSGKTSVRVSQREKHPTRFFLPRITCLSAGPIQRTSS